MFVHIAKKCLPSLRLPQWRLQGHYGSSDIYEILGIFILRQMWPKFRPCRTKWAPWLFYTFRYKPLAAESCDIGFTVSNKYATFSTFAELFWFDGFLTFRQDCFRSPSRPRHCSNRMRCANYIYKCKAQTPELHSHDKHTCRPMAEQPHSVCQCKSAGC